MIKTKRVFSLFLCLYGFAMVHLLADAQGTWVTDLARMGTSRQELAVAALDGLIYTIGGYSNVVEVYDPESDQWARLGDFPVAGINHNVAIGLNGYIYHFGGTTRRAFRYDPSADKWEDITPPRYVHDQTPAIAVIDGLIYLAGGVDSGRSIANLEVYDPDNDAWEERSPMNVSRNHIAGGAIRGKFYVAGGRPGTLNVLEEYDPETDRWTIKRPMPTGRSGIGATVVNDCLYVFGGEMPGIFRQVEAYNPATDTWVSLEPMPTPRHGIMAVAVGNVIYIPAGAIRAGLGATNVNEAFVVDIE
jgi:N-acetylneuraminic acid mutarotase